MYCTTIMYTTATTFITTVANISFIHAINIGKHAVYVEISVRVSVQLCDQVIFKVRVGTKLLRIRAFGLYLKVRRSRGDIESTWLDFNIYSIRKCLQITRKERTTITQEYQNTLYILKYTQYKSVSFISHPFFHVPV